MGHPGLAAALLASLTLSTFGAGAQDTIPAAVFQRIERALGEELAARRIPGLSVAVGAAGELRWSAGLGMADLENLVPARAGTVYRTGSIAKPITAVAVLQLAERGKLDLDAPVQEYVPEFPTKPWPVTARLLLGHLAGIRHYRAREFLSVEHYFNLRDPLKVFMDDPLMAEPGTKFVYSTYGYSLLGAIVEAAAGMPFTRYLEEHIFRPAGMVSTRADDVFAIIPNRARGYQLLNDGRLHNATLVDTSNKIPGGGLVATAEDLVRLGLALQRGTLLGKASRDAMFTPQRLKDGRSTGYGLGWYITRAEGRARYHHGGAQSGASTFLALYPQRHVVLAWMMNLEGVTAAAVASRLEAILLVP